MNKTENFAIWLDGFLSAIDNQTLNEQQTKKIKDKLNDVFDHVVEREIESESESESESNQMVFPQYDPFIHNHIRPGEEGLVRC
jgi:hypothetical protein